MGSDWNSLSYLKIQTLAQAVPSTRDTSFRRSLYLFPARRLEMVLFRLMGYQSFLRSNQICHLYFVNHKVCQSYSDSLEEANVMLMMQSCLKIRSNYFTAFLVNLCKKISIRSQGKRLKDQSTYHNCSNLQRPILNSELGSHQK